IAPENCETDARSAALRLERRVVITTGQPPKRARRRSHERSRRSTARRPNVEPMSKNNAKAIGRGSAFPIFPPCGPLYTPETVVSSILGLAAAQDDPRAPRAAFSEHLLRQSQAVDLHIAPMAALTSRQGLRTGPHGKTTSEAMVGGRLHDPGRLD